MRQKLLTKKDLLIETKEYQHFEFKKTLYSIQPVFDPFDLSNLIGYMIIIESNNKKLLESVMQNRLSLGKKLRINFNESDDLEKRIIVSLKFLNQIYGASKNNFERILQDNINKNITNVAAEHVKFLITYFN